MGAKAAGETPHITGESVGKAHGVLECIQTCPPANKHPKGHNPLVRSKGNDGKWSSVSKQQCSLSDPSPPDSTTMQRYYTSPIKIPVVYFTYLQQILQKFIRKQKRFKIASEILRKKSNWRDHNT